MRKKYIFLSVLMSVVLSLCVGSIALAAEKTLVTIWESNSPEAKASLLSSVADCEANNPDIKIDVRTVSFGVGFEKVMIAVAGKSPPDTTVIWGGLLTQFADLGALEPLDQFGDVEEFKPYIWPAAWPYGIWKGNHYALVNDISPYFWVYNKRIFKKAGIANPPGDWEEFRDVCAKTTIAEEGIYAFPYMMGHSVNRTEWLVDFFWSNGADFWNEDVTKSTLDSEEAIEALEFAADLVKNYGLPVLFGGDFNTRDMFIMGKTAMVKDGPWIARQMRVRAPDMKYPEDWGFFPSPPRKKGMKFRPYTTAGAYVMYKDRKAPGEVVYRVMKEIAPSRRMGMNNVLAGKISQRVDTWDEYLIKWIFPEDTPYALRDIQKFAEGARMFDKVPNWGQMMEMFLQQTELVFAGKISAEKALGRITKEWNSLR